MSTADELNAKQQWPFCMLRPSATVTVPALTAYNQHVATCQKCHWVDHQIHGLATENCETAIALAGAINSVEDGASKAPLATIPVGLTAQQIADFKKAQGIS